MMWTKYLWVTIFFVLILFSGLFFWRYVKEQKSERFTPLKGYQFVNPDLIFGDEEKPFTYINEKENPDFIESNGYYVYGPIENDYGIIVLHPISREIPRYLGTFILLNDTTKNYTLQIKVGNIGGKIYFSTPSKCNDNVFEILLSDIFSTGNTYPIARIETNSNDGWIYKEYDLNEFKGKNYYLQILSEAGGKCGDWNGEWGAIGYLNLKEE